MTLPKIRWSGSIFMMKMKIHGACWRPDSINPMVALRYYVLMISGKIFGIIGLKIFWQRHKLGRAVIYTRQDMTLPEQSGAATGMAAKKEIMVNESVNLRSFCPISTLYEKNWK